MIARPEGTGGDSKPHAADMVGARVLRLARHMAGLSQRGFAARLRLGASTVEKAEKGRRSAPAWLLREAACSSGLPETALVVLADAARGCQLSDEQRAWLAEALLHAALRGLRDEATP